MPVSLLLLLLLLLVPLIWFTLAIDVVQIAAAKLGFAPDVALLLLILVILGSTINLPLYKTESEVELVDDVMALFQQQFLGIPLPKVKQTTIVALNIGGGLIPAVLALYQFQQAVPIEILIVIARHHCELFRCSSRARNWSSDESLVGSLNRCYRCHAARG